MRVLASVVALSAALLLSGTSLAQEKEPTFRGVVPASKLKEALQGPEDKASVKASTGPSSSSSSSSAATSTPPKPHKSAGQGVALSYLIVFEYNSDGLTETAKQQLDSLAEAMKSPEFADSRFEIEGHTDAVGSEPYNYELSKRRADAVVNYLIEAQGIARSRLSAIGVGERDLYDPAHPTAEENRRVRIIRLAS